MFYCWFFRFKNVWNYWRRRQFSVRPTFIISRVCQKFQSFSYVISLNMLSNRFIFLNIIWFFYFWVFLSLNSKLLSFLFIKLFLPLLLRIFLIQIKIFNFLQWCWFIKTWKAFSLDLIISLNIKYSFLVTPIYKRSLHFPMKQIIFFWNEDMALRLKLTSENLLSFSFLASKIKLFLPHNMILTF